MTRRSRGRSGGAQPRLPVDFDLVVDLVGAGDAANSFLSHLFDKITADGAAEDDVLAVGMRSDAHATQVRMLADNAVDADLQRFDVVLGRKGLCGHLICRRVCGEDWLSP